MKKVTTSSEPIKGMQPARTPEEQDNYMHMLAVQLVEQRLLNGTATAQETVYYLKLGSQKERLERQILEKQSSLLTAKTEVLESQQKMEELYTEALAAMKKYSGSVGDNTVVEPEVYD